jgi:hypothetical protein
MKKGLTICAAYNLYIEQKSPLEPETIINMIYGELKSKERSTIQSNIERQ